MAYHRVKSAILIASIALIVFLPIGLNVLVSQSAEELTSQFFSYKRHDELHRCVAKTPTWQDGRETNVRVRLPPAKYCVVPCTFLPGKEGDFILRVHIERYSREGGRVASAIAIAREE